MVLTAMAPPMEVDRPASVESSRAYCSSLLRLIKGIECCKVLQHTAQQDRSRFGVNHIDGNATVCQIVKGV